MRALILDDDEGRHEGFAAMLIGVDRVHVRTADEALAALDADGRFDVAYLDHDLTDIQTIGRCDGEKTGTDVARHIAAMPEDRRPARVVVHSYNPDGAQRMVEILRDAGVNVARIPYGWGR